MTDTWLAILFTLILLYLSYRLFTWNYTQHSMSTQSFLQTAYTAYTSYPTHARETLSQMRASYASVSRRHKRIGYNIGYPAKLEKLEAVIRDNERVTRTITRIAEKKYPELESNRRNRFKGIFAPNTNTSSNPVHFTRVIETLKHFVRDWSDAGAKERQVIHSPILDALTHLYPDYSSRNKTRILLPGAGLARLAYDISLLGFTVKANELSGYMLLALEFLLSEVQEVNEFKVHPYAHWFSHQRTKDGVFRGVHFPDIVPRSNEKFQVIPGDFLQLEPEGGEGYDVIVTLFFIDTSTNVLATLDQIHALLKPGGIWINLGPLLWPGGAQAKLELSLEEVLTAAREVGFEVVGERDGGCVCPCPNLECDGSLLKRRTVECEYTKDEWAMMRWIYQAEFWAARKA